jgi:hypothetical protein
MSLWAAWEEVVPAVNEACRTAADGVLKIWIHGEIE